MKNNKIRNSLIAASIAVLAGVLVLGVSIASGDAPGYAPPSAAGVSPVFTGVTVDDGAGTALLGVLGGIQTSGPVYFSGDFTGTGDTNRFDGDLEVDGTLEVVETLEVNSTYGIRTSSASDAVPVKIDDDLTIAGDVSAPSNTISGATINSTGSIFAGSNINATGWISSNDAINSWGDIYAWNDLLVGGNTTVSGNLNINGNLGRFYEKTNSWVGGSVSCDSSAHTLISCGASAKSGSSLTHSFGSGTTCYAGSSASVQVYVKIKCFDPDGVE